MTPSALSSALKFVSQRQKWSERLRAAGRALAWAWIVTSCFYAAVHLAWGPPPAPASVFVFVATTVAAAILSHSTAPTDRAIARLIDHRLDLKDRLATALEYQGVESPIAAWLREDAEQKARLVKARKVVPLPPRLSVRGKLLLLLLAASTALWLLPLPAGILSAEDGLAPLGDDISVSEDEIFERAARVLDELRSVQSAQLQRIQRDIAQLQAGLRDRSLPRDEALALLQLLERRARSALEALRSEAGPSANEADLDRLQDLANRLVAAAAEARSGNAAGVRETIQQLRQLNASALEQNPELERLLDQLGDGDPLEISDELLNAANNLREAMDRASRQEAGQGTDQGQAGAANTGDGESGGETNGSLPPDAQGANDSLNDESGSPEGFDPESTNGSGDATGEELGASGAGTQPQSGTGSDGEQGGEFSPNAEIRELHYLPGEILDGPIRTGTVQSNLSLFQEGTDQFRVVSFGPAASIDAEAIEREQLPLAYRETVKRYFQSLEPTSQ